MITERAHNLGSDIVTSTDTFHRTAEPATNVEFVAMILVLVFVDYVPTSTCIIQILECLTLGSIDTL